MTGQMDANRPDFEVASLQLNEGLKSCQAVVRNYRAMLENPFSGDESLAPGMPAEATDERQVED